MEEQQNTQPTKLELNTEQDIVTPNALELLLFLDKLTLATNMELAVPNLISGKQTKKLMLSLVILVQPQAIINVQEVNAEMEVIDIMEFVTKMAAG